MKYLREAYLNGEFKEAETASSTYLDWDKLSDVVLVDSADYEDYNTLVVDVYGELYFNACILDATRNGYALFNLNKNYEKWIIKHLINYIGKYAMNYLK